jgi:hypothetical protein
MMNVRAHGAGPGPGIDWGTTVADYIGLDVSLKETAISVRRTGKRVWRGKCASARRSWQMSFESTPRCRAGRV